VTPELASILQRVGSGDRIRAGIADLYRQLRIRNILLITVGIEMLVLQLLHLRTGLWTVANRGGAGVDKRSRV
jgi:hypothetical protein